MSDPGLSEEDRERIEQFLETPAYERDPEQLTPGGRDDEESAGETSAAESDD